MKRPVGSSRNAKRALRMEKLSSEPPPSALLSRTFRIVSRRLASLKSRPKPSRNAPSLVRTPVRLRTDQPEALEIEMTCNDGRRVEIEIRLWRLRNDMAVEIKNLRAEDDQIDLALRARPFKDRLIEADDHARYRMVHRVLDDAREGTKRNRSHQEP